MDSSPWRTCFALSVSSSALHISVAGDRCTTAVRSARGYRVLSRMILLAVPLMSTTSRAQSEALRRSMSICSPGRRDSRVWTPARVRVWAGWQEDARQRRVRSV